MDIQMNFVTEDLIKVTLNKFKKSWVIDLLTYRKDIIYRYINPDSLEFYVTSKTILKIYHQRKDHPHKDWRAFCEYYIGIQG
jgi:hypothetical protein